MSIVTREPAESATRGPEPQGSSREGARDFDLSAFQIPDKPMRPDAGVRVGLGKKVMKTFD
jgi:hypothetical protein